MTFTQPTNRFLIIAGLIAMLTGCGSSSSGSTPVYIAASTTPTTTTTTTPASTYLVEYIPGMVTEAVGKTTFTLRVRTRSTSAAAPGLTISLNSLMHMKTGMNHSTPVDTIVDNGDGTYTCTVYYLMMSGSTMGYWELQVTIGTETASFYPTVGMAMPMGTVNVASLYGPEDAMTANTNKYYLFMDGASNTNSGSLYISHSEEMKMKFVPVTPGATLASPTGAVNAITVEVSPEDNTFAASNAAANLANGHWTVDWSSFGLSSGAHNIFVRMTVNGQDKTKNGGAPNTGANVAAFNVTL